MPRDRDPTGRARSSRPRDATGRPLPRGAEGVPQIPDGLLLPPSKAVAEAERLLAEDRPFAAHEVLEAAWKAAPATERDLWQGLAQMAVGLTHVQRGNLSGAAALLRRGANRVESWEDSRPYGLDVTGLRARALGLAGRLESTGPESTELGTLGPEELRWRLLGGPAA